MKPKRQIYREQQVYLYKQGLCFLHEVLMIFEDNYDTKLGSLSTQVTDSKSLYTFEVERRRSLFTLL